MGCSLSRAQIFLRLLSTTPVKNLRRTPQLAFIYYLFIIIVFNVYLLCLFFSLLFVCVRRGCLNPFSYRCIVVQFVSFFLFFTFFFFVVMTVCFVAAWVIGAFFFFYRCCWAVPSVRSIDRRERKGYTLNDPRFRQSYKRKHIEACMFFFFFSRQFLDSG